MVWLFVKHPLGARMERKKVMGAKGSGRRMAPVKGVRLGRRSCRVAYCNHYGPPKRSPRKKWNGCRYFTKVLEFLAEEMEASKKEWEGVAVITRSLGRWVPLKWMA